MESQNPKIPSTTPVYYQSIVQPGKKYDCSICNRDTGSFTFIFANNNNYCIPCFAKMKKWPSAYHVINKLEFPVLDENWSALEEIYLFEGLEKHGYGNWNEIADYIQTNKTKDDVQKHYIQFYLNSPNFIPDESRLLSNRTTNVRTSKSKNQKRRQTFNSKRIQTINQQKSNAKATGVEIVGYMPLRKDFQYEYDNEAQLLLAEMEFNEEDTEQEREMKFKIIELYNKRLTERNKKKEFVLSRGILDLEKQMRIEKTLPKSQKEIYNMMKIFSRFQTAADHEELVTGIIRQKQLRQKIQQYKELRRRGFTTKAQIQQQIERKNQTKTKKKSSNQYGFSLMYYDGNRNHRRFSNTNGDVLPKKLSIYFTHEQIQLLKSLKLSGISYMMIKQTILRQFAKLGTIDRDQILSIFSVDKGIVNSIISHLVDNGEIVCTD